MKPKFKKIYKNAVLILALVVGAALFAALSACNQNSADTDTLSLYDLVVKFDEEAQTLTCRQEVLYINREDADLTELMFSLAPAAFREGAQFPPFTPQERSAAYYAGASFGGIEIEAVGVEGFDAEFEIGGDDQNILIVPVSALAPNATLNVKIDFCVKLPKCNGRMGITPSAVNLGNFYPILCVYENGAYQTNPYYNFGDPFYSDAADYLVTLDIPEKYIAASSGTVENSYVENGRRIIEINAAKCRDFAAVLSKNFKTVSDRVNGVDINYYYVSDTNPQTVLSTAKSAIEVFSDAFGSYPYPVFNVAQTGLNSSGMEYSNLVFISSALFGAAKEETVIHETAHQWWYGVVGCNQIANAWLDEGLAEFSTAYYFRLTGDSARYSKIIGETLSGYVTFYDFIKASNPSAPSGMNRALNEFSSQGEYVVMSYYKGALMFDTLLEMYGEKKLNRALSAYFDQNSFAIANPDLLVQNINRYCKGSENLVKSWIDGTVSIG